MYVRHGFKNRLVYFKTADSKNIKQVSLADIDFSASILGIEINTKNHYKKLTLFQEGPSVSFNFK